MEINKENFKQLLLDYFEDNYKERLKRIFSDIIEEFPYSNDGLSEEFSIKNIIDWLMIEKSLPDSGKTVVEEFIDKNPDIPEDIQNCMIKMNSIIRGDFEVISYSDGVVILKQKNTRKEYKVKLYYTTDPSVLKRGRIIKGRIHEFDEYCRFAGIFTTKIPKSNILSLNSSELMELLKKDETRK